MKPRTAVDLHSDIAVQFDRKYDENSDFIERFNVWTKTIDRHIKRGGQCLDLGCGSGVFTQYIAASMEVTAVDGSGAMIELCKKKQSLRPDNISYICSDINSLPSPAIRPYDLIICSSVLEYIPALSGTLSMIQSLLAEQGTFIFSLPNRSSIYRKAEKLMFSVTRYPKYYQYVKNVISSQEAILLLDNIGLKSIETTYYGQAPVVSSLLRNLLSRQFSDNLFLIAAKHKNG